jgi:hypothetical protein
MKRIPLIIAILILAATGVTAWWLIGRKPPQRELVLYGDVDLRQVDLPSMTAAESPPSMCRKATG